MTDLIRGADERVTTYDPGPVPPESDWPYDPPQVPKELLDIAATRFFGANPSEPTAASLEAAVVAVLAEHDKQLRAELAGYLTGDLAMTNREMTAFNDLGDDEYHEKCGPLYMAYAARMVREAPYGQPKQILMARDSSRSPEDQLLTVDDLATRYGVKKTTIYSWNHKGTGPRLIHAGRLPRYRMRDVLAWESRRESA